jgi:hypothetical protein
MREEHGRPFASLLPVDLDAVGALQFRHMLKLASQAGD